MRTKVKDLEEQLEDVSRETAKALDEASYFMEQLKKMQEERKRDVEDTAEFIKTMVNANK